jgi:hypothetical protein
MSGAVIISDSDNIEPGDGGLKNTHRRGLRGYS